MPSWQCRELSGGPPVTLTSPGAVPAQLAGAGWALLMPGGAVGQPEQQQQQV
jgi:hypothetical protein